LYSYTWLIRAIYDLYKSALALRILFYFLCSLYVYSSPYSTKDTHYRLIEYITFGVLLCVTHKDHLAVPTIVVTIACIVNCRNCNLFTRRSRRLVRIKWTILYLIALVSTANAFASLLVLISKGKGGRSGAL